MAIGWNEAVKSTGKLTVYADPSLKKSSWGAAVASCIKEFNRLAKAHELGVVLESSNQPPVPGGGGADVAVVAASGQIDFRYDGVEEKLAFDGGRLHGRTRQVQRDGGMEKAYVYLPAQPLINTPKGRRPVGPGVLLVIGVHEFVHACGLTDAEHSAEDLFQGNPTVDSGRSSAQDRVMGQRAGQTVWMPALFLSPVTAKRIKDNWA